MQVWGRRSLDRPQNRRTTIVRELEKKKYREVAEIDDGPGHARGAAKDREHDEPGEKKDEDVGGPYAGVHEPLGVLVQIRWRDRLDVQLRHGWGRLVSV
jgi:hypothetical protein